MPIDMKTSVISISYTAHPSLCNFVRFMFLHHFVIFVSIFLSSTLFSCSSTLGLFLKVCLLFFFSHIFEVNIVRVGSSITVVEDSVWIFLFLLFSSNGTFSTSFLRIILLNLDFSSFSVRYFSVYTFWNSYSFVNNCWLRNTCIYYILKHVHAI